MILTGKSYTHYASTNRSLIGETMKKDLKILGMGFSCIDIVKNENEDKFYPGGTAANVLTVLGLLDLDVNFLLPRYSGKSAQWLNEALLNRNIKLEYFTTTKNSVPQIIEYIDYAKKKHKFMTTCPECNSGVKNLVLPNEKQVVNILYDKVDLFSVVFYDRISMGIRSVVRNNTKAWKYFEPNSFRFYSTFLGSAWNANILKISKERFPDSFEKALLQDLQDSEVLLIIITLGDKGLKYALRNENDQFKKWSFIKASEPDRFVDSSGAGDWFSAIFIYELLRDYPYLTSELDEKKIVKKLKLASKVSAEICGYEGAQGILSDEYGMSKVGRIIKRKFHAVVDRPYVVGDGNENCEMCLNELHHRKND